MNHEAVESLNKNPNIFTKDFYIVVDFDNQFRRIARLDKNNPDRLTFDLSELDLPLSEIEKRYFTETSHINGD